MLGGRLGLRPSIRPGQRCRPSRAPGRAGFGHAQHQGLHHVIRISRHHDIRLATGVLPGPDRGRPAPGPHRPQRTTSATRLQLSKPTAGPGAGRSPARARRRSSRRAAAHRRRRRSATPARRGPGTRPRVGEDGPAQGDSEATDVLRAARARTRDDQALRPGTRESSEGVERARVENPPDGVDPVPRPTVAPARGQLTGVSEQRFSKSKVRVHRARPQRTGRRLSNEAASERAPARSCLLVGHAGVHCPPQRPGEQPRLLDGLGRSHVMELRRPVRSADDERHPATGGPRQRLREPRPPRSRSS